MNRPLCFVMLPYRAGSDENRQRVDFPAVYASIIAPAIHRAGMTPLRADEDLESRGVFQKTMFERLVLCEYAVADLTHGNPNVYYELGVRHALRPHSTVLLFRDGWPLPLDLAHDSAMTYSVSTNGAPVDVDSARDRLTGILRNAKKARIDSPVHQLVSGLPVFEIDHSRIDSFRDHADRDESLRRRLDLASSRGVDEVRDVAATMGDLEDLDLRSALALLLAYRAVAAFTDLVVMVESLSQPVARVELIQQQYLWALNRAGKDREAERVAKQLIADRPSSETYGLLGRIYRDRWKSSQSAAAGRGFLYKAIESYVQGFQVDWRDPYPGINAVTLMALAQSSDRRLPELLPIVEYSNQRRLSDPSTTPDYWDFATELGLAVLRRDGERADDALGAMLASEHDPWQVESTCATMVDLRNAWSGSEDVEWLGLLIDEMQMSISS